jgi:aminoglycoside phosphotransferase (APT) family kinase protein
MPFAGSLRSVDAELAQQIFVIHEALAKAAPRQQRVMLHGDFTMRQLVAAGSRTAVLDFDRVGCGDPMTDLARFLARMARDCLDAPASGLSLDAAREALLAGYATAPANSLSEDRLAWFEAATTLAMALQTIRLLRPDWKRIVNSLLALARIYAGLV